MAKTIYKNATYAHSFWRGCQPVSEGCARCYARRLVRRNGKVFETVGRNSTWKDPFTWQRKDAMEGKVETVFTCALSDFFHPDADAWRREAWAVIKKCPNLIWQILTKRPHLIAKRLPKDWGEGYPNVWLGVTVELKKYLHRMDTLRKIPASARFLCAEPLLEDLTPDIEQHIEGFHWLMTGGECGKDYRPMDLQWARNLRDLCTRRNIAFYFIQRAAPVPHKGQRLDGRKHFKFPPAWDSYRQLVGVTC